MSEEAMKILELLKEGKIDAEDAQDLLEKLTEKGSHGIKIGTDIKIDGGENENAPKGFLYWLFKKFFFTFIPMILGLGLAGGVLYCLLYYLPFHLATDKLLIIYGVIGIIVLCGSLIAISAIGVGRLAVKRGVRSSHGDVVGGPAEEKLK